MKIGDAEYNATVQRKLRELRGNVSRVKMTPEECSKEIRAITEGSFDANGSPVESVMTAVADTILPGKRKRGRPVGSNNKSK